VPSVSPTVCEPTDETTAPVVPPQAAFAPVPAVAPSTCRLNLPLSVVGTQTLFTVSVGLRVFVIVQVLLSPASRVGALDGAQSPPVTDVSFARSVPVPAVSLTVCDPTETIRAPVPVPQAEFSVANDSSMRRLNLPVSDAGTQTLFTVSVG